MKKKFFKPMMLCFLCMITATFSQAETVERGVNHTSTSHINTASRSSTGWTFYQYWPADFGNGREWYTADFVEWRNGFFPPESGSRIEYADGSAQLRSGGTTTYMWGETEWIVVNGNGIRVGIQLHTEILSFQVEPGDVLVGRHELHILPQLLWRTSISLNGVTIYDDGGVPFTGDASPRVTWMAAKGRIQYDPVWENISDLRSELMDPVDWTSGLTGRWGYSTHRKIPVFGRIEITSLVGGTDSSLSSNGLTFDRIGTALHSYVIRDDHSLSALYPFDTTSTSGVRKISVFTVQSPSLRILYSGSAEPHLVGTDYNHDLETILSCNGESGWTNQPLDIAISPDTIIGTFDAVLALPDSTTTATNASATRTNYHIESPSALGTPISGVLTAVGDASNLLSGTINGFVKIDKTNPIPAATHVSGYSFTDESTDALSGLSVTRPSKIAFSAPSGPQPASGDFHTFDAIPTMPDGTYDIWVTATDKASNTATERVLTDILLLNGTVELTKDTDQGATLHTTGCTDFAYITISGCAPECSLGANIKIEEKSALTYKLTLTNTDTTDTASGTFEDYLPEGAIISMIPTITPVGSATVTFDLETTGPYTGRYKVSGTYTDLASGGQIEIDILTRAPAFDKVTAMNNIITNQASTNWTIGTGPSERTGSTDSNSAVHELLEIPSVNTLFTKVGANDLDLGLVGTEFALYRWDGALAPTTAEQNHIVDYNVLVDNTLPDGDWVRVTYDGEDALALTDIFVSSASPLGEVDLGSLPEGVYTLIETKTVGGYALPMGQWILTIAPSKGDTGANDWKIEFAGKSNSIAPPAAIRDESVPTAPTYKIVNAEPFLIGLSGLEGTTGMLLTGFIIMAIATNTYLVRRHKQKEKQARQETHTF